MRAINLRLLALIFPITILLSFPVNAAGVGNAAAIAACKDFPPGALKCLTDVSFVICTGSNTEIEQFVAAGTHCEQGIPGERVDQVNVAGLASATRVFEQRPPDTDGAVRNDATATATRNTVEPVSTDTIWLGFNAKRAV